MIKVYFEAFRYISRLSETLEVQPHVVIYEYRIFVFEKLTIRVSECAVLCRRKRPVSFPTRRNLHRGNKIDIDIG